VLVASCDATVADIPMFPPVGRPTDRATLEYETKIVDDFTPTHSRIAHDAIASSHGGGRAEVLTGGRGPAFATVRSLCAYACACALD
jgi:hypothetical protein